MIDSQFPVHEIRNHFGVQGRAVCDKRIDCCWTLEKKEVTCKRCLKILNKKTTGEKKMTAKKVSLDLIKAAGVDMKLSKNDILDILVEDMREEAETAFTAARTAMQNLACGSRCFSNCTSPNTYGLCQVAQAKRDAVKKWQKRMCIVTPEMKKLKRAMEKFFGVAFEIVLDVDSYYHLRSVKTSLQISAPASEEGFYTSPEAAEAKATLEAALLVFREAEKNYKAFNSKARKAKVTILKSILQGTPEGEILLELLEARTAKAGLKKIRAQAGEVPVKRIRKKAKK